MVLCVMVFLAGWLVTARLTRFVTDDSLFTPVRVRLSSRRDGSLSMWWVSLLECPWCVSIWIAAPVAGYGTYLADWPAPGFAVWASLWLSWSYLTGALAMVIDD